MLELFANGLIKKTNASINLAFFLRKHLGVSEFDLHENIAVVSGYKDQRKLLDRAIDI